MADDADNTNSDNDFDAPESIVDFQDGGDDLTGNQGANEHVGDQPTSDDAEGDDGADDTDEKNKEMPDSPNADDGKPDKQDNPDQSEDPKEKARREYQERQERKASSLEQRAELVTQKERRLQTELDPDDPDYRLKKLESNDRIREAERIVSEVRANQQALRNDHIAVQSIPFFGGNPEALKHAQDEFSRLYLLETDDEDPEDREILGAFDPRTGQPVSYYQFMLKKAEEYEAIGKSAEQHGKEKERRMRNNTDPIGGASRPAGKDSGNSMRDYLFGDSK